MQPRVAETQVVMRPPRVGFDDSAIVEHQIQCLRRVDPAELPPNWLEQRSSAPGYIDPQLVSVINGTEQIHSAAWFPSSKARRSSAYSGNARSSEAAPVQRDGRGWRQGKQGSGSRGTGSGDSQLRRKAPPPLPHQQRPRPKSRARRRLREHIESNGNLHEAATDSVDSHVLVSDRGRNFIAGSDLRATRMRNGITKKPDQRHARHELAQTSWRTRADSDIRGSRMRIFHAVLTTFSNHATRCRLIMQTWGSVLPDGLLAFYSDRTDESLPVVAMQGDGYLGAQDRFTNKVLPHAYMVMRQRNASWLFVGDDDTFLWPENLRRLLLDYDPTHWVWLGQRCPRKRSICGGAGFVMSLLMVEAAACVAPLCWVWNETNHPYDIRLSVCLSRLLYAAVSNRIEFNSQAPAWYFKYWKHAKPELGPGRAVTYHYMMEGISADDEVDAKARQHYLGVWMLTRAAEAVQAEVGSGKQVFFETAQAVEHAWPDFGAAANKLTADERRRAERKPLGYHSSIHARGSRYRLSKLSKALLGKR